MVQTRKIDINTEDLYKIALIENEGLGTAYEYYVKLKLIENKIKNKKIKNVLIYGLPEKYGYSLDFLYIAKLKKWNIDLIEKSNKKNKELEYIIKVINKEKKILSSPKIINKIEKNYDIILSCEYYQKLNKKNKEKFIKEIKENSKNYFLFIPNKDNKLHSKISKLKGVELNTIIKKIPNAKEYGYIDCPPFPPGIKKKKKINLNIGKKVIKYIFYFEKIIPKILKKRIAHIIYVFD